MFSKISHERNVHIDTGIFQPAVVKAGNNDNPVFTTVRKLINVMPKLPGITADASPAEVHQHRQNLLACVESLDKDGLWAQRQDDSTVRPVAVGLQAIFEQALLDTVAAGEILHADIIFTTANPLTPLCQAPGNGHFNPSLTSGCVAHHPGSYDTVISRTHTVPQLLGRPEISVCAIYSRERADPIAQAFYDSVCREQSDPNKFYSLRSGISLPDCLSGACYFVVSKDNNTHLFGLRITQANIPTDNCVVFTKDNQQLLMSLRDNYVNAVAALHPEDEILRRFMSRLDGNYM